MKKLGSLFVLISLLGYMQQDGILAQGSVENDGRYFIDVHELEPGSVTFSDVAKAHEMDLNTQGKYNVSFITYWVDEENGKVYCLSKAEKAEDVHATHEEAHGLVPSNVSAVVEGEQENYTGNGYLFLDIHELGPGNVTAEAVAGAHAKDLETQSEYGVNFINYWVDEENGRVFCLSEAIDAESVATTHEHAHGLVPNKVLKVIQGR